MIEENRKDIIDLVLRVSELKTEVNLIHGKLNRYLQINADEWRKLEKKVEKNWNLHQELAQEIMPNYIKQEIDELENGVQTHIANLQERCEILDESIEGVKEQLTNVDSVYDIYIELKERFDAHVKSFPYFKGKIETLEKRLIQLESEK